MASRLNFSVSAAISSGVGSTTSIHRILGSDRTSRTGTAVNLEDAEARQLPALGDQHTRLAPDLAVFLDVAARQRAAFERAPRPAGLGVVAEVHRELDRGSGAGAVATEHR